MDDITQITQILQRGGAMLYPTDTLWGLGCDATNEAAVAKIFALKQRSDAKSLIVLVDGEEMLAQYVREVPPIAWDIVRIANVPQTIIYPQGVGLAGNVCATNGSVAIRIAHHRFCQEIIRRLRKPLVSTSANLSGSPAPTRFEEVDMAICSGVDVVVSRQWEGQPTRKPSSIIRLEVDGRVEVIR